MNNNILNNKYIKIFIPLVAIFALVIILLIYFKEYKISRYKNTKEEEVYQYLSDNMFSYKVKISYNKKDEIVSFVPVEYKVNYDTIPIYFKKKDKVVFPSEMSIIFPLKNDLQRKTKEFSYIERNNNYDYLVFNKYNNNIDHYILFNGKNLYFFNDTVNINIDNKEYILSPFSYIVINKDMVSYYNYKDKEYITLDSNNKDIIVCNKYYKINITNNSIIHEDEELLLTTDFSFLKYLEESKK